MKRAYLTVAISFVFALFLCVPAYADDGTQASALSDSIGSVTAVSSTIDSAQNATTASATEEVAQQASSSEAIQQASSDITDATETDVNDDTSDGSTSIDTAQGSSSESSSTTDTTQGETATAEETSASAQPRQVPANNDAQTTAIAEGPYTIESSYGTVLDVAGGSTEANANIQVYNDNETPAQRFNFIVSDIAADGTVHYRITNIKSGLVVDAIGNDARQNNFEADSSQLWALQAIGSMDGWYRIVNVGDGMALALAESSSANGVNACTVAIANNANQYWKLNRILPTLDNGKYAIISTTDSEWALDIQGGSLSDCAAVIVADPSDASSQVFEVTYNSATGYYAITNENSGKCLDVPGASVDQTTRLQQYASNGTWAQQWSIVQNADGSYTLICAANGLALDVPGCNAATVGTQVWQYAPNGTNAQKFMFEELADLPQTNMGSDTVTVTVPTTKISEGVYIIASKLGTVIDIAGASINEGANTNMYASNQTAAQRFLVVPVGVNDDAWEYAFINVKSHRLLTASSSNVFQGAKALTNGARWIVTAAADGSYVIYNVLTGKVLSVVGNSAANCARLTTSNDSNATGQRWIFQDTQTIEDGAYTLTSAAVPDLVMDDTSGSGDRGNKFTAQNANGTLAQDFAFTYMPDSGYYEVTCYRSGLVLDVPGASSNNGTQLQQYDRNGTWAQRWAVVRNADGTYTLYSAANGLAVDVCSGTSAKVGERIWQYTPNGTAAQKWTLTSTTPSVPLDIVAIRTRNNSDMLVDDPGGSFDEGTAYALYETNGTFSQKFQLSDNGDGTYTLLSAKSTMPLAATSDGKIVQQQSTSSDYERWIVAPTKDGYFTLKNVATGTFLSFTGQASNSTPLALCADADASTAKWSFINTSFLDGHSFVIVLAGNTDSALDVTGRSLEQGANVQFYTKNGTMAQTFRFELQNDNTYEIYNIFSMLNLDVYGAQAAAGTNVQQWGDNSSNAQHWTVSLTNGGYVFKSGVGSFALGSASLNANSNAQLVDVDSQNAKLLLIDHDSSLSFQERIDVLNSFSGDGLVVFHSHKGISDATLQAVINAVNNYYNNGYEVGCVMMDLKTGAGVAFNANQVFYSACTIKAPYIVSTIQAYPESVDVFPYEMYQAIYRSDNPTYFTVRNYYGTDHFYNFINQCDVYDYEEAGYYGWYSARSLAKFWSGMSDYFLDDNAPDIGWSRDVFGNNIWITVRGYVQGQGAIYAKSGNLDGNPVVHCEGCLVTDNGNNPYVMAIMGSTYSSEPEYMGQLYAALAQAHASMV